MDYTNIAKHRCMDYLSHEINLKSIVLFNTFLLIPLKNKLQLRQGFKLFKDSKRHQYYI
jgi:hypothetical protein